MWNVKHELDVYPLLFSDRRSAKSLHVSSITKRFKWTRPRQVEICSNWAHLTNFLVSELCVTLVQVEQDVV